MSSLKSEHYTGHVLLSQASRADRRRWAGLAVLCVALFLEAMNLSSISVQIPAINEGLHLSTAIAQFVVSAYLVAYAGFLLLGGRIADLFSRRLVFMGGVVIFGLASLAAGLAQTPVVLVAARACQGIGAAFTTPAAMSIIVTTFAPGPERNRALGIYSMIGASGFAIGAVLAGILTSWLSWRWGFFDYVVIAVLVLLLTPLLVARSKRPAGPTQELDLAGAICVTVGLLILVYAVGEANAVAAAQTLGSLAVALLLLSAFLIIEARGRAPMLPLSMFRLRTLTCASLVAFTQLAGFTCMIFISTLYLQNILGFTPFQAGLVFVPMGVEAVVVSNLAPPLMQRLGSKQTLVLGLLLLTVGIALTALISTQGTFWNVEIPSLLVGGGLSLAFPAMIGIAVADVRDADQGLASGLMTTSQQLGGALGLALITFIAALLTPRLAGTPSQQAINQALVSGFQPALLLAAALALLGTIIALVGIKRSGPQA
ncbi:MAG TPA: MFS transporter [Ktedonobacteraceae bacterium]|jgi:EmrB/QacA subfamily drug resistance transporter